MPCGNMGWGQLAWKTFSSVPRACQLARGIYSNPDTLSGELARCLAVPLAEGKPSKTLALPRRRERATHAGRGALMLNTTDKVIMPHTVDSARSLLLFS